LEDPERLTQAILKLIEDNDTRALIKFLELDIAESIKTSVSNIVSCKDSDKDKKHLAELIRNEVISHPERYEKKTEEILSLLDKGSIIDHLVIIKEPSWGVALATILMLIMIIFIQWCTR